MQLFRSLLLIKVLLFSNVALSQIGDVSEQSGAPGQIRRESGEKLPAEITAPIISMDVVETENGRLKIQFVDDTMVSLTEHTVVEINEYVYDPNPSNSKMALNFAQGTARFATGRLGLVAKENIAIKTPTASIGSRGTDFTMSVDEIGRSLVILLPDENCTDTVKLEEGCAPSGSITVTNQGGTQILDEAYQAVMVSTFETIPTTPVVLNNIDLSMIDNMFIVQPPKEIEELADDETGDSSNNNSLLDFDELDQDFLEQDLLNENFEDLSFTELDIDYLGIDYLADLLDVMDPGLDLDPVSSDALKTNAKTRITGTANPGFDETTLYNTIIEDSGILFIRILDGQGKISIRIPAGNNARLETDAEPKKSIICVNDCSDTNIFIKQSQG